MGSFCTTEVVKALVWISQTEKISEATFAGRVSTLVKLADTDQTKREVPIVKTQFTDICLCLPPDRTWHNIDYSGGLGRGKLGMSRGSSPAWLYWLSTHLVRCGPDEPSWVQARMPDYSLNWTMGSRVIQGWQRCQWCGLPIRKRSSRCRGPLGLKSAMEYWPFGTDAKQSPEQSPKM